MSTQDNSPQNAGADTPQEREIRRQEKELEAEKQQEVFEQPPEEQDPDEVETQQFNTD